MITRSTAIKNFLTNKTFPDLANLYSSDMECQVNVAQDGGKRVDGEFKGRRWQAWTDDIQTWASFRLPLHANSEPEDNDREIKYDLAVHAEAIGMTGWNWRTRKSEWVAFDFDSIVGHKSGLNNDQLLEVVEAAKNIEWVTLRKSTSGKGLHIYVFLEQVDTKNHNEHAALARAILGKMSALAGYDFNSKVDICGGNMWVWHRKMEGTQGLQLIKQGSKLVDIPINWQDHINVVTNKQTKVRPQFIPEGQVDVFDELSGQRPRIPLDSDHKKLIDYLQANGCVWWWVSDHHMLVTHTIHLKEAHEALQLKGKFQTLAEGKDKGNDHNCYMFAGRRGSWVVRRYSAGCQEAPTWSQDAAGWTRCTYNCDPDLPTACRSMQGIEHPQGGFVFREAEVAEQAVNQIGVNLSLPTWAKQRSAKVKQHPKDSTKLIVEIKQESTDSNLDGWLPEKGNWKRVFSATKVAPNETETANFDDLVRHLVTKSDDDYGWVIKSDDKWKNEPLVHVKAALKSMDLPTKDIDEIIGGSVMKCWTIVNMPFKEEYPGDRQWNRNAAQFRFSPSTSDTLNYPSWKAILDHVGFSLNESVLSNGWCQANGILTGADYLKCWIASLFQFPLEPLPYLFLYSPEQNTGKSIFHEALSLLMTKGYVRAENALTNQQGHNGELESAILCIVEEIDLSDNKVAYNRIKDWVTSRYLPLHVKYATPCDIPNSTHWLQCSNSFKACPIFQGDTRITMIYVAPLDFGTMIPKSELLSQLEKEAPDFLAEVLKLELPKPNDRLNIPVIQTEDKMQTEEANQSDLQRFIKEQTFQINGEKIKYSDFCERFVLWLDPGERHKWTKPRIGRELGPRFPKGRLMADGAQFYIGNISFTKTAANLPKLILYKDTLKVEGG